MNARYSVRKSKHQWQVWDLEDDQAMASFDSLRDAQTCGEACELARRDSRAEDPPLLRLPSRRRSTLGRSFPAGPRAFHGDRKGTNQCP